jgi:hypothetical protein
MKVSRISDWDLEDRLWSDHRTIVVMFSKAGEGMQDVPREELRNLAASFEEARFFEVDLLESPSLVQKYSVTLIPTTLVFVDGVERGRHVGPAMIGTVKRILGAQTKGNGK